MYRKTFELFVLIIVVLNGNNNNNKTFIIVNFKLEMPYPKLLTLLLTVQIQ